MVLRRVCCREGLSRSLLVRTARRFPSRARSACGGSSLTRAAASSMASGNPSRWAQISATFSDDDPLVAAFMWQPIQMGTDFCDGEGIRIGDLEIRLDRLGS